jgi:hypothetical protein
MLAGPIRQKLALSDRDLLITLLQQATTGNAAGMIGIVVKTVSLCIKM